MGVTTIHANYNELADKIALGIEEEGTDENGKWGVDYTSTCMSIEEAEDVVADLLTAIADAKSKVGA